MPLPRYTDLSVERHNRRMSEPHIYTVASYKGGVGKTTLASELAYVLDAVLLDLDWDRGNATRAWGYRTEQRVTAPLLDAIEAGRTPRPLKGARKADLVPCHEDFVDMQPEATTMAGLIERWAKEWGRDVVADTHPGGSPSTLGAMSAAHRVLVPAPFGEKEHEALEGMVGQLADYPLMVVPSRVPPVPPERDIARLRRITQEAEVPVGPPVSNYVWLPRRTRRMAVSAPPVAKQGQRFAEEVAAVAEAVRA